MKNIFVFALLASLIISCSIKNTYEIIGTVPDAALNDQYAYLISYDSKEKIDSALVIDGKFTFKGTVNEVDLIRIDLAHKLFTNIILESGEITVDLSDPLKVSGTPLNNQLIIFQKEKQVLSDSIREGYNKIKSKYADDQETFMEMMEKESAVFLNKYNLFNNGYFYANKDNALGKYIFISWYYELSIEKLDSIYADAGDIIKKSIAIQQIMQNNELKKLTVVGKPFTDFTIENGNKDNTPASFSDYVGKGKYVLVDFWASWCGPCMDEAPIIAEVYEKYKGEKFEVLGVAVWDKRDATLKAIEDHNMVWPQIIDAQSIPTGIYGINGIPHIILIDPDGIILERDLRGYKLKKKIAEIMSVK